MLELREKILRYIDLDEKEWAHFSKIFREINLKKGNHWVNVGRATNEFAFVKNGVLRHYFVLPDGKEYNKNFFWKNEFAGVLSSLISKKPSLSAIESLTDCTLMVAKYDHFVDLFASMPKVETFLRRILEEYFIYYEQYQYDFVTLTAKERYFKLLKFYPLIEKHVSQYQIASYLGITPVQFSRIKTSKLT